METLQWHEPSAFRRAEYRDRQKQKPWEAPKTAAICFGVILGLRGLAGMRPNPNMLSWGWIALLAAGVGLGIAYLLPFALGYLARSVVILSEKGVNNNIVGHGATIYFWSWDEIAYCTLGEPARGGRSYPCLLLHDHQRTLMACLALAEKPSPDDVRAWLQSNDKFAEVIR
jgi:hypothetical protein